MPMRSLTALIFFCWPTTRTLGSADVSRSQQCSLYIGESSTSTEQEFKWGVYSGSTINADAVIGFPELAIQSFNMAGSVHTQEEVLEAEPAWLDAVVEFFEQYIWVPDSSGSKFELDFGRQVTAISGVGVLGAYNPDLTNSDWSHYEPFYRSPVGEQPGVTHPGRGAYSPYYNISLKARHKIPRGMEIFVDYGNNYAKEEEENENELSRKDYDRVDEVSKRMVEFYDDFEGEMTPEAKRDIYDFLIKDVMGAATGLTKGRLIAEILPDDIEGLRALQKKGGSYFHNKPSVVRDEQWLQTNAFCADNLKMGASTIPNAGRGAFATRDIKNGAMVSPVPLVQIPDKDVFDMHEVGDDVDEDDEPYFFRVSDDIIGQQQLLNYVFGHSESSMVFFPAGSQTLFINHNSEPNAKIVWSKSEHHHSEWFDVAPEDMIADDKQFIGLMLEVVATRDIKEDEEVFIDYGPEWTQAYEEHTKEFNEMVKKGEIANEWPLRALDFNEMYKGKVYKTPEEVGQEPYPDDIMLAAFLVVEKEDDDEDNEGVSRREWSKPLKRALYDSDNVFECRVMERKETGEDLPMPYNYTVVWSEGTESETIVFNIPHYAFVFVDKPGKSDLFFDDAFRHWIGIPDDIFPVGPWRDLA